MNTLITRRKQNTASIRLPRQTETERPSRGRVTQVREGARSRRKRAEAVLPGALVGSRGRVSHWERVLFASLLTVTVLLACFYIGTKITTTQMRFEMTESKQHEIVLMKERERLQEQVSAHKKPERVEKRARQRGMVTPDSGQIITLP